MFCSQCGTAMDFRGQQRIWVCGACGFQSAGPAPGQQPAGAPMIAMRQPSAQELADQRTAQSLVTWSHVLGWGGIFVLIVGSIAAANLAGATVAGVVAGLSVVSIIVGAILGQIGRGMQGRVI